MYGAMAGKTTFSAREALVARLAQTGEMRGEPIKTVRQTNFFEKGDKPLEIVTSRQWYIRNGGKEWTNPASGTDLRDELLERGRELEFHPDFMRVRYENWVRGLNNDWLVSRQRFFGVPFPLWYKVGSDGEVDYDAVLTPDESELPVDPSSDVPAGYTEDQRGRPGGFVGELDIMDTWATSSLSPQLASGWLTDEDLFGRVYPMDLRPQGQDIIRTWLFTTVVRADLEFAALPWRNAGLSGWILDSDHKKMSKSKGNVVTPMGLLEQYGSDAVRYWASSARLGLDAAFEETQIKIGRRLAIKVLNASKFALSMGIPWDADEATVAAAPAPCLDASVVSEPIDARSWRPWPTSSTPPRRPSRSSVTPGPWRSPSPSSGPSAMTTSSWSRTGPMTSTVLTSPRPCARRGRRWRSPWTPSCACWPPSCRLPPRRCGAGTAAARCTGRPGRSQ